jgi:hypothetical protein
MEGKKKWKCHKKSFTKREAEYIVSSNIKSAKQYRRECRLYYCDIHNAWHLTSEEQEETIDIEIKYKNQWEELLEYGQYNDVSHDS